LPRAVLVAAPSNELRASAYPARCTPSRRGPRWCVAPSWPLRGPDSGGTSPAVVQSRRGQASCGLPSAGPSYSRTSRGPALCPPPNWPASTTSNGPAAAKAGAAALPATRAPPVGSSASRLWPPRPPGGILPLPRIYLAAHPAQAASYVGHGGADSHAGAAQGCPGRSAPLVLVPRCSGRAAPCASPRPCALEPMATAWVRSTQVGPKTRPTHPAGPTSTLSSGLPTACIKRQRRQPPGELDAPPRRREGSCPLRYVCPKRA